MTLDTRILYHGTTAVHEASIMSYGLTPPWPGRGVSLTTSRGYAEAVARSACLRARLDAAGSEEEVDALVVVVRARRLRELWRSVTDSRPSYVTAAVSAEAIERVDRLTVCLPPVGSLSEAWERLCGGNMARRAGELAEPTLDAARRFGMAVTCQ